MGRYSTARQRRRRSSGRTNSLVPGTSRRWPGRLHIEQLESRCLLASQPLSLPLGPAADGIPAGNEVPEYLAESSVDDAEPAPILQPQRMLPLGSQVTRSANNTGWIDEPGDVDDFRVFLQEGQLVSAAVTPASSTATLSLALVGVAGPVAAPSAGTAATISPLAAPATGTYTLRVLGDELSAYSLDVFTNAVPEVLVGDSRPGNALPLDASHLDIGAGRFAAVGEVDPVLAPSVVYQQDFNLDAGGFAIDNTQGSAGGLWHWTTGRQLDGLPRHSPAGSLYFGQQETPLAGGDYQTGSAVGGSVVSPAISIPDAAIAATLRFNHLLQTEGATDRDIARVDVLVDDQHTTLLDTSSGTLPTGTDGRWETVAADLTSLAGQEVRLRFHFDSVTPELNDFEGWFIDDVRIEAATMAVPDLDLFTIDLAGRAGHTVDVVLAGETAGSQESAALQLLGPDGTTVLATGSSAPPPMEATNFDVGILDYTIPADGEYTLRVVSESPGAYTLVVADSLAFETEPNNDGQGGGIRDLDGKAGAVGYLGDDPDLQDEPNDTLSTAVATGIGGASSDFVDRGVIGDHPMLENPASDVDLVRLDLEAGARATFEIHATRSGSSLDPILTLFNASGQPLLQNDDYFGLDSYLDFTAVEPGPYFVGVSSYFNFAYDPLIAGSGLGQSTGFYDLEIHVGHDVPAAAATFAPKTDAVGHDRQQLVFAKGDPVASVVGHELAALALHSGRISASGADDTQRQPAALAGGAFDLLQLAGDYVAIDAVASGEADDLWDDLHRLGIETASMYQRVVSGLFPVPAIEQLAELASLQFARPVYRPTTNVGSTTSQADEVMRSDLARSMFQVDGAGITVGVLSDSYDVGPGSAAEDIASGDLPGAGNPLGHTSPVQVLSEFSTGTDEGRAMLQLVHDVAPAANLAFHTAFAGEASFANGILELESLANADVIVDDVIYLTEPMFQDGMIAQAVDEVAARGSSYFSSAGNNSRLSWEGGYQPSGVVDPLFGTELHDFDPGEGVDPFQSITVPANSTLTLAFQWDSPFFSASGGSGSPNDLDIFVFDDSGSAIRASSTTRNVGQDALEVLTFNNTGPTGTNVNLALGLAEGAPADLMKWVAFGPIVVNEYATDSPTSFGHANAASAAAVGAAFYRDTPQFGQSPPVIEAFSSAGGVPILFDSAGNRTYESRVTPDFVAPDGTNTTFFGDNVDGDTFPNFFGTSAAAPHAAAVAALMAQLNPLASPADIYAALSDSALDMDDPLTDEFDTGFDARTGAGLIDATRALSLIESDPALTGPQVVSITPADEVTEDLDIRSIMVKFSESPTADSATSAGSYELLDAGANGIFEGGAGDDRTIDLVPVFDELRTVELVVASGLPLGVGRYQLTVRQAIADEEGNPLGSTTGPGGGSEHQHVFQVDFQPPPQGDYYRLELAYGQAVSLSTDTPWDASEGTPLNDLDPRLALFDSQGRLIEVDQDSALDGKNATLRYVARTAGTYLVHVSAESGIGEYVLSADVSIPPPPVGDYNRDGFVNAADYVLWRVAQGTSVLAGTGADGNHDGLVDSADYEIWRENFGNSIFNTDTTTTGGSPGEANEQNHLGPGPASALAVARSPNAAKVASFSRTLVVDEALAVLPPTGLAASRFLGRRAGLSPPAATQSEDALLVLFNEENTAASQVDPLRRSVSDSSDRRNSPVGADPETIWELWDRLSYRSRYQL